MLTEVGVEVGVEVGTEVVVPVESASPAMPSAPEVLVDLGRDNVVPVEALTPVMPSKPVANKISPVPAEPNFIPMVAIEPASS